MEFTGQLEKYILEHGLFTRKDKLLLAVSGGIDSIVLVHALSHLGYLCSVAHCNFQLRGSESEADEQFVKSVSKSIALPYFTTRFDTLHIKEETGGSIQMVARNLRYVWFEKIRNQHHFDFILTAHHQNDLVETIILNLVRGTGIQGLHGIIPKSGFVVRPLLFANKQDIEAYAEKCGLKWREDQSNESTKYARNLIRKEVVPVLKQLNPSLEKTTTQTSELIKLAESFIENQLKVVLQGIFSEDEHGKRIHISSLIESKDPVFMLNYILKKYSFLYSDTLNVLETASGISGKLFYSPTHRLLKDREYWIIDDIKPNQEIDSKIKKNSIKLQIDLKRELRFEKISLSEGDWESLITKNKLCLDFDKLQFPISIRNIKTGDQFSPLGLKGTKKVSDYLTDLKFNLFQKEEILVLESGGKIAAILPSRPANGFEISKSTTIAYVVQLL